jgi:predicted aspartyl protease
MSMNLIYKGILDNYFQSPIIEVAFMSKDGHLTKPCKCIIDTGAYHTYIQSGLVDFLGLEILDKPIKSNMAKKSIVENKSVKVSFVIGELMFTQVCAVLETGMDDYSALIGTEFLKDFEFLYSGHDNYYSLYIK